MIDINKYDIEIIELKFTVGVVYLAVFKLIYNAKKS